MYEKTSGWQNEREYEGIKHNTTNKVTQNKMSDKRQWVDEKMDYNQRRWMPIVTEEYMVECMKTKEDGGGMIVYGNN